MRDKETKRQHFVPRTYLKHFATERNGDYHINVLSISDSDESHIWETSIKNVCVEKDFYTLAGNSTEERMFLEILYGEYEMQYNQVYQLLIDPNKTTITDSQRELILSTVATMLFRTTKQVHLSNMVDDMMIQRAFAYPHTQQLEIDCFIFEGLKTSVKGKTLEQIQKEIKIARRPAKVFSRFLVSLDLIKQRLSNEKIVVKTLVDDNSGFITSDNPVTYYHPDALSPSDPRNVLHLPLDNNHILALMPFAQGDSKYCIERRELLPNEKMIMHDNQAQSCERFLFGSKSALKSYLETKRVSERPMTASEIVLFDSCHASMTKWNIESPTAEDYESAKAILVRLGKHVF